MVVADSTNALLAGLDARELALVMAAAKEIPLQRGALIAEAGQAATAVYFPIVGVLSLVGMTSSGATVEVAIVGNEGVASVPAILGRSRLPFRVVTQVPGRALMVPTELVSGVASECGQLQGRLQEYTHQLIAQIAQSAVCNRFHNAKQRLARWLLMTADRADSKELALTHEFISYMVGGPRSAVTEAAAELRESGAIDYRRGFISIRDVARLGELSCECYSMLSDPARAAG